MIPPMMSFIENPLWHLAIDLSFFLANKTTRRRMSPIAWSIATGSAHSRHFADLFKSAPAIKNKP
jgi:hypothetical protein